MLGKGSGWIFYLFAGQTTNISKYNPLMVAVSSYINLPKELDHPKLMIFKIFMTMNALTGVWSSHHPGSLPFKTGELEHTN